MIYIKILSAIALMGSIAWLIVSPGFEPALAVIGSLSALISVIFIQERKSRHVQQQQSVSKSSVGIQAGGDVNIGDNGGDKHA